MDYIEKLNLQTDNVEEIEELEKHIITNSEPISVDEYEGHDRDFLTIGEEYDDGFNQLNETNRLGIFCSVSKEVNEIKSSLDNMKYYVTPEMFGAIGDGVSDDTQAINKAIATGNKIIFAKDYKFSEITLKNSIESVGKLTGNIIIDKSNISIIFNTMKGNIKLIGKDNLVQQCNVKGIKIVNTGDCITLQSEGNGVQYNNIEIGVIKSNNGNCLKLEQIRGWINNNYITNTVFTGNCGIYSTTQTSIYDGMVFNNVGFEHISKWFILNNCNRFIFKNFRMMPYEAYSSEQYLGEMINSNAYFGRSITGVYPFVINTSNNSTINCEFVNSNEGEIIADKVVIRNGKVISVVNDSKPQLIQKLSELNSSTLTLNYQYNYKEPIYINCDESKYVWFNIAIPLIINGVKCLKIYLMGEPQNNIEVAVSNILKLTIQPSNFKSEYTLFLE